MEPPERQSIDLTRLQVPDGHRYKVSIEKDESPQELRLGLIRELVVLAVATFSWLPLVQSAWLSFLESPRLQRIGNGLLAFFPPSLVDVWDIFCAADLVEPIPLLDISASLITSAFG